MYRYGKNIRRILPLLLIGAIRAFLPVQSQTTAQPLSFAPIGLPSSRSPSPIFNRYASLPPFTARQPSRGEWFCVPTLEIAQAMITSIVNEDGTDVMKANLDYETISLEAPISYGLTDGVSLELDLQIQYIWGGFLDGIIDGFHGLFGFPNNSRKDIEFGNVTIDVDTKNGYSLKLSEPALLVSDPVFGAAFRMVRVPRFDVTGRVIGTLPLGLGRGLAGTSLPQLGAGVYIDWRPVSRISAHALLAGVLPLESIGWTEARPFPMAHARLSALVELSRRVFLFVDFNFKSSPIRGTVYDGDVDFFHQPNADLLVGFVVSGRKARSDGRFGAFSVQEDPFSHNSSDIRFIGTGAFRYH